MTNLLGLYNYWVVIFLMMTGFYIVIARSNLIQKVIGLNIFQISVFLLYITMGKVTGGTAPILPYHHEHGETPHAAIENEHATSVHGPTPETSPAGTPSVSNKPAKEEATHHDSHHAEDSHDNESHRSDQHQDQHGDQEDHAKAELAADDHEAAGHETANGATQAHDQDHDHQQLYTHPLPSVLMLTAIVVGVATTALALALVIRIGEAYGTIEEDEILLQDRVQS